MPSAATARDRRNDQHFVPLLEAVLFISQKANIFLVHIEVDEAANLAVLAAQMLAKSRKAALHIGYQLRQIGRGAGDLACVVGVLLECIRQ